MGSGSCSRYKQLSGSSYLVAVAAHMTYVSVRQLAVERLWLTLCQLSMASYAGVHHLHSTQLDMLLYRMH